MAYQVGMFVFGLKEADGELSVIFFGDVDRVDAKVATPSVKQSNVSSLSKSKTVSTQRKTNARDFSLSGLDSLSWVAAGSRTSPTMDARRWSIIDASMFIDQMKEGLGL